MTQDPRFPHKDILREWFMEHMDQIYVENSEVLFEKFYASFVAKVEASIDLKFKRPAATAEEIKTALDKGNERPAQMPERTWFRALVDVFKEGLKVCEDYEAGFKMVGELPKPPSVLTFQEWKVKYGHALIETYRYDTIDIHKGHIDRMLAVEYVRYVGKEGGYTFDISGQGCKDKLIALMGQEQVDRIDNLFN